MAPAAGLLVIWTDVTAEAEADFDAWYDRQHLAERVAVPGFRNGRRYVAVEGAPKYLAWYETETPAVLGSPAYGARQAQPTEWTRRVMPHFRNVIRVTGERLAKAGSGLGAAAATLRLRPAPGNADAVAAALAAAPASALARDKVVAAQSWRPSTADAATGTTEARLRAVHEAPPAWGLVIEATDPDAAGAAARSIADGPLAAAEIGVYRLLLARGGV